MPAANEGWRARCTPTAGEILATLDETGATAGMPFMPEMLEYYGKAFRVEARAERACDTIKWGVRRIPDTVMLDDLRAAVVRTRVVKRVAGCSGTRPGFVPLPSP